MFRPVYISGMEPCLSAVHTTQGHVDSQNKEPTYAKKDNRSHTWGPCVQISVDVLMVASVK